MVKPLLISAFTNKYLKIQIMRISYFRGRNLFMDCNLWHVIYYSNAKIGIHVKHDVLYQAFIVLPKS